MEVVDIPDSINRKAKSVLADASKKSERTERLARILQRPVLLDTCGGLRDGDSILLDGLSDVDCADSRIPSESGIFRGFSQAGPIEGNEVP